MDILLNDIPEELAKIGEIIGMEKLYNICQEFGGSQIYIPKVKSIERKSRDRKIKKEYKGYNVRELSIKYKMSANQIKNIAKAK